MSSNIHEIVQKSIQAKAVIEDVTKDEKKLNVVNTKIYKSSEILMKINKLLQSIQELEHELVSAEFDYWSSVAELLIDVQSQISYFDPYQAIPYIIEVREKLDFIETELRRQIQWNFREIGQLVPNLDISDNGSSPQSEPSIDISSLQQVSLVIDALGQHFRVDLMERFAQLQLIPYEKLFNVGAKYSSLEFFDRRYLWFKRLLKVSDDKVASIFPTNWMLPYYLFQELTRRTKKHIYECLSVLENNLLKSDPSSYVQSVLKTLKGVITFEAEMKSLFNVYTQGIEDTIDPKLMIMIKGGKRSMSTNINDDLAADSVSEKNSSELDVEEPEEEIISMAEAFDNFLGPYVQLEREELDVLMTKIMGDEVKFLFKSKNVGNEDEWLLKPGDPFISSRKMFEFIKKSLKRCTAYSTGETYLSLSKEFRICLHNYAEALKFRCPSPEYTEPGKPLVYNVNADMEEVLCRIIVTGEYCIDTVPQLEAMMKNHIRGSLTHEIDFSDQIDAFNDMVAFTIGIMTSGINQRIYPIFKKMRNMSWSNVSNVVDESPYVKEVIGILNEAVPRIRSAIPAIFFQSFCMKLVTSVLDSLLDNIWKLKRITQTGAGQLLLDLNGIKEYLLRCPNARLPTGTAAITISNPYKIFVNNRINHIQVILKLVCTDDDKMEEMFAMLWPDGTKQDFENIMAIKSRGGNNILAPVNVVGDQLKEHTEKLGNLVLGEKATGDIKSGLGGIKNNVKSSVGGFFSDIKNAAFGAGDLFSDGSGQQSGIKRSVTSSQQQVPSNASNRNISQSNKPK